MDFETFEILEGTIEAAIRISVDGVEMEVDPEAWSLAYKTVSSVEDGMGIPTDDPNFEDAVVKFYLDYIATEEEVIEEPPAPPDEGEGPIVA